MLMLFIGIDRYGEFYVDWGAFTPIFIILGVLIALSIARKVSRKLKKTLSGSAMTPPDMGLHGKTQEQKKIIKYFMSTGILGMIFRISDSAFDNLLNSKADELVSRIEDRALEAHGMDADEVKEIPPILVENYYSGSRYFKMFRDLTFRASEYQMTYLMFSDKQMYAYSYIFDLTSDETTEQTKEYFFEDITNVEITKKQIEHPAPRPMEYIVGGYAGIIIGILLMMIGLNSGREVIIILYLGLLSLACGVYLAFFWGFSRRLVDSLVLRLTVPNDEFVCSMKSENIEAIQGMKAKLRDKKA